MSQPAQPSTDARDESSPFWERYRQLCNRRGSDFWSIVFGYPIARLFVLLVLPISWITPSLLTLVGFVCKLAAAVMLWRADLGSLVLVVALMQVAQILDSMDGTLARARQSSSLIGAYFDKVTDALGLMAICAALGWRAAHEVGQPSLIVIACAGGCAFVMRCYMFWIVHTVRFKDADDAVISGAAPLLSWADIGREWLRGFASIYRFREADMYFWIPLGLLLGLPAETVYLVAITQAALLLDRMKDHVRLLRRVDRE